MKKLDAYEKEVLLAYERGELQSSPPTQSDLSQFKLAAAATFIQDKQVNIRLSTPDLLDIQARALEAGIPYQAFISSVLHKYASGRLLEKPSQLNARVRERADEKHIG